MPGVPVRGKLAASSVHLILARHNIRVWFEYVPFLQTWLILYRVLTFHWSAACKQLQLYCGIRPHLILSSHNLRFIPGSRSELVSSDWYPYVL